MLGGGRMRIRHLLLCCMQNLSDAGLLPPHRLRTIHQVYNQYTYNSTTPMSHLSTKALYNSEMGKKRTVHPMVAVFLVKSWHSNASNSNNPAVF